MRQTWRGSVSSQEAVEGFQRGRLYVGEFPKGSEAETESRLREYLSRFGRVRSVQTFRNCFEKIFAFVTMEDEESLAELLGASHLTLGHDVDSADQNRAGFGQFQVGESFRFRPDLLENLRGGSPFKL